MTKEEAVSFIMSVQNGSSPSRRVLLGDFPKSRLVEKLWNDETFILGMEWRLIIGVAYAFDIKAEDLVSP